jgi:tRNA (mo5U34)-methyltransferase
MAEPDDLVQQARERFVIDDSVVSAFGAAEVGAQTTLQRTHLWANQPGRPERRPEYLIPRVVRTAQRETPAFMVQPRDRLVRSKAELEEEVRRLAPWTQAFSLDHDVSTMPEDELRRDVSHSRANVRRDLITGTVADLLGSELATTSILDIGCNSGFFSLDAAARGARHVDGVDLRETNIAQARFLAGHYGIDNVTFSVTDIADLEVGRQWDVVMNLGVLYHVTDPVQCLRQTYELCRRFAVIDTLCHLEPVSAYLLVADKDVGSGVEGRESLEFLPTYRGAIDTIRHVGFSDVFEVVGPPDIPHVTYAAGRRRCFLAIK